MSEDVCSEERIFILMVQTMALVSLGGKPRFLPEVAALMYFSSLASQRLPEKSYALNCALEFAEAFFPDYAGRRSEPTYKLPTWLHWLEDKDWKPEESTEEECVDGKWRPVNRRWVGLEGDNAVELNLMAALRDNPRQTVIDLSKVLHVTDTTIRSRLARLEDLALVSHDRARPSRWSLTYPSVNVKNH